MSDQRERLSKPLRQTFDCQVREAESDDRTLRFVASTEKVARDGDIIRAGGWDTEDFERNPVFLFSHQPGALPIGRVTQIDKITGDDEPRLEIEVAFAGDDEGNPLAESVYRMYRSGFMNAVSVGFRVRGYEKPDDDVREDLGLGPYGVVITAAELLEVSAVAVPADPGALMVGRADAAWRSDAVRIRSALPEDDRAAWDPMVDDGTYEEDPPESDTARILSALDEIREALATNSEAIERMQALLEREPAESAREDPASDPYLLGDAILDALAKRKKTNKETE